MTSLNDGPDDPAVWARVRELRAEGLDSQVALAQARQEHEVESAVDDLDLDLEGEDATGSCSLAEAVNWVADSIAKKSVKSSDAPSSTAWGLLKWAKSSSVTRAEFYKSIFVKILPSNKELENQARYSDTGLEIAELADRIRLRMIDDQGYKPPGCEHCNPAWHGPEAKQRLIGLTRRKYEQEQARVDYEVAAEVQRQADAQAG